MSPRGQTVSSLQHSGNHNGLLPMRNPNAWKSNDRAEQYVRDMLTRSDTAFENHWFSDTTGHGEYLGPMQATIPGQFGKNHGIDIFALDFDHRLWLIEVSRGRIGGAARFKGGGLPVKYAGGKLQMSSQWRAAAAEQFLTKAPDALEKLRYLFNQSLSDERVVAKFRDLLVKHRKAVIIPLGAHFDAIDTDVDFNTEVYTCRFPSTLFRRTP